MFLSSNALGKLNFYCLEHSNAYWNNLLSRHNDLYRLFKAHTYH